MLLRSSSVKKAVNLFIHLFYWNTQVFGFFFFHIASLKVQWSPVWCGSVGWSIILQLKVCGFNLQSGHTPRLQVWSPIWAWARATLGWDTYDPQSGCWSPVRVCAGGNKLLLLSHWMFFFLSLPLSLKATRKKCTRVRIQKKIQWNLHLEDHPGRVPKVFPHI